jgi:MOSC domain-containing protein YiiM
MASIVSINVGRPRAMVWRGKTIKTAIFKHPIAGRISIRKTNIDGDAQAALVGHGGSMFCLPSYLRERLLIPNASPEVALEIRSCSVSQ